MSSIESTRWMQTTSIHKGTCSVLQQAMLVQACRAVLAMQHLSMKDKSTTDFNEEMVSNVSAAESVPTHNNERCPQNSSIASPLLHNFSFHPSEVPLSAFRSREDAMYCIRNAHQYSLLTAVHLLRCPCYPYRFVKHRDGTLVGKVDALQRNVEWCGAVLLALCEFILLKWKTEPLIENKLQQASEVSSDLHLVKRAHAHGVLATAAPHPQVLVPDPLLIVFPELGTSLSDKDGASHRDPDTASIDCNCQHPWFREHLPRWLLMASVEEHAVVWREATLVRHAFTRWRQRRGIALLQYLVNHSGESICLMEGKSSRRTQTGPSLREHETPLTTFSPPEENETRAPSTANYGDTIVKPGAVRTGIDVNNDTSIPLYQSGSSGMCDASSIYPENWATAHTSASNPLQAGGSPNQMEGSRDPNFLDDTTRCECMREVSLSTGSETVSPQNLASIVPRTPERHSNSCTKGNSGPLGGVREAIGGAEQQPCALSRSLVQKAFVYWRDTRYYERMATRYLCMRLHDRTRRTCFTSWRRATHSKLLQAKNRKDNRQCEAVLQQQQTVRLCRAFAMWRNAAATKHFSIQTVGRRMFATWRRQWVFSRYCKSNVLWRPGLRSVAQVALSVWYNSYRQRLAISHQESYLKRLTLRKLHSVVRDRRVLKDMELKRDTTALRCALHKWRHREVIRKPVRAFTERRHARVRLVVFHHWATRLSHRRESQICASAFADRRQWHQAKVCLRMWAKRTRLVRQLRGYQAVRDKKQLQVAFQGWVNHSTVRAIVQRDMEVFADLAYAHCMLCSAFRMWRAQLSSLREKRALQLQAESFVLSDAFHARYLRAQFFFRWKCKAHLAKLYNIDNRRSLPLMALPPVSAATPSLPVFGHPAEHELDTPASVPGPSTDGSAKPVLPQRRWAHATASSALKHAGTSSCKQSKALSLRNEGPSCSRLACKSDASPKVYRPQSHGGLSGADIQSVRITPESAALTWQFPLGVAGRASKMHSRLRSAKSLHAERLLVQMQRQGAAQRRSQFASGFCFLYEYGKDYLYQPHLGTAPENEKLRSDRVEDGVLSSLLFRTDVSNVPAIEGLNESKGFV